jgi:dihydroorotase
VTAEVTPHHLCLTEEDVLRQGTYAKVNPPLRTKHDTEALLRGLNNGVIDIVATDHAPHTAAAKKCKFTQAAFGISGLETALASLCGLVLTSNLTLKNLIEALTLGPARVLGFEKLGTLEVGAPADVTILDLHREWVVDPEQFASKGKNTPLAGRTMKGKVMATFLEGRPVYMDESMKITGV